MQVASHCSCNSSDTTYSLLDLLIFLFQTYFLSVCLISKGHWLIHATELSLIHRHFNCSRALTQRNASKAWISSPSGLWALKCLSLLRELTRLYSDSSERHCVSSIFAFPAPRTILVPQEVLHGCLLNERRNEWMKPSREIFYGRSQSSLIINIV